MRRREFFAALAATLAAAPPALRAQTMPVVVFFSIGSSARGREALIDGLHRGLAEMGYIDGKNLVLSFHWGGDDYDRLHRLAAEIVRQPVSVIFTPQLVPALAAKAATATIPIVFLVGDDPVKHGLAASLSRPGGNATGISMLTAGLVVKRLEFVREVMSEPGVVAVLVNRANANVETQLSEARQASDALDQEIAVYSASTDQEIETAFAELVAAGAKGLVVGADPFLNSRRAQLIALAARHALPAIYEWREFADQGGLMSYGTNLGEATRQLGVYVGRILKGARPADLPIEQPIKFELVINLKTAQTLGLTMPQTLLARADEVIE
ncbi:MAG: ABC transporter substrate-binding protein [Alphaproteobacteria bacterium]